MENIIYGYFKESYVAAGYITNLLNVSVQLKYSDSVFINLKKGFKYAVHEAKIFQASEYTIVKFPFYTASKLSQLVFEAVFPQMTDLELENLRTFMFTNLPLFETFELALAGQDVIYQAKFKERKIKVKQILNDFNEVTISFILV